MTSNKHGIDETYEAIVADVGLHGENARAITIGSEEKRTISRQKLTQIVEQHQHLEKRNAK